MHGATNSERWATHLTNFQTSRQSSISSSPDRRSAPLFHMIQLSGREAPDVNQPVTLHALVPEEEGGRLGGGGQKVMRDPQRKMCVYAVAY